MNDYAALLEDAERIIEDMQAEIEYQRDARRAFLMSPWRGAGALILFGVRDAWCRLGLWRMGVK